MHRWKQRDIHEKREVRKHKIKTLGAQIACNQVLLPRIEKIHKDLSNPPDATPAPAYFNSLVDRLQINPSRDCPPGNDPKKLEQTYDGMLLSLLKMVGEKSNEKVKESGAIESDRQEKLTKALISEMEFHVKNLAETISKDQTDLVTEEAEQKKHITSDDMHDGFESHVLLSSHVALAIVTDIVRYSTYHPNLRPHQYPFQRERRRRRRRRRPSRS